MDEFCANKDSQLKRCACSSRANEFDDIKEQLTAAEDKLLDFNQRLLTVNMDKEDAEAIFTPTEGELAFQQDDNSQSKKLLDEIAEKLNDTFDTESYNANLAPISLSLNVDAAFDTVDSLAGASTTLRSGPELYASALPICREMAMEVCTADELNIVESGYQMAIEQDCNTVAKAYQTQQDLAREKIREGSALLDISRLDIYQQRNSDDILTCKKKMLDMLTNTAVCGEGLQKCLDITGQYIDPSTGEAILTSNLINLSNLITRPESGQSWTTAPGNEKFVSYLTSKKMFLESATDKCQDIADSVWDGFIEDALAQIKLAQEEKMEEVRQSCTTLTAQCLSDAADSLEDFDARALSIFGVAADKTVKQMCSEVQTACTALLDTVDGGTEWNAGITEIATDKTYETILQTCREVGRACIIQSCKSISGNFGLCENIQTSVNRKAIINRTACWGEVLNCVADAGIDSVNKITELRFADGTLDDNYTFYETLYGQYDITDVTSDNITRPDAPCILTKDGNCIYDICASECGFDGTQYTKNTSDECHVCRLAERVWGNCEAHPTTSLNAKESHNKIKLPVSTVLGQSQETLLSWFAKNTNTEDESDSCRDTSCGPGFAPIWDPNKKTTVCVSEDNFSGDNQLCPANTFWQFNVGNYTNCCKSGNSFGGRDAFGNCCAIGNTINGFQGLNWGATAPYAGGGDKKGTIPDMGIGNVFAGKETPASGLCLSPNAQFVIAYQPEFTQYYGTGLSFVFCNGGSVSGTETNDSYPNGQKVSCSSSYILINKTGQYMSPLYNFSDNGLTPAPDYKQHVTNSYQTQEEEICKKIFNEADGWTWATNNNTTCPAPANWSISY